MHRARGQGTCIAHPSAFTEHCDLKLGPPLQSAWAVQDVSLANLYTSVLINALPFIRSWGALLLSCAAWINMVLLCGHSTAVTLRAAHRALTRVLARTPLCSSTQSQMYHFSRTPHAGLKNLHCTTGLYVAAEVCKLGRV